MSQYTDFLPDNVKAKFGSIKVPLLNGKSLIKTAKKHNAMIMAVNIRCRLPVEGIARASMETGAPVLYEIARSELGYTEFTPDSLAEYVVEVNDRLGNTNVPFGIHADHLTVKNLEDEKATVDALIKDEIKAGFTSFAIDASHMENEMNLKATTELARQIQDRELNLEVELGEIGAKSGDATGFTKPEEASWFIGSLNKNGINPDLLAINNGSIHGTYFGSSHEGIQLDLTKAIYDAIQEWDVDIAQHGITGTNPEKIRSFINYGVRKGNVGTLWQNISFGAAMDHNFNAMTTADKKYIKRSYRGIPDDLWEKMVKWAEETGNTGGNIKKANKVFAAEMNGLSDSIKHRITGHAFNVAVTLFEATNSIGLADKVLEYYK
jgi:fructose-bisphosphate aldolase, class II